MKEESRWALKQIKEALASLADGVRRSKDDLDQDGVIKRFEFTFEVFWKGLKALLEDKGILKNSPKDCLAAAFRAGLLGEEKAFLDMLEDRNKTTHIYDEEEAQKVFQRIAKRHLPALLKALVRLQKIF